MTIGSGVTFEHCHSFNAIPSATGWQLGLFKQPFDQYSPVSDRRSLVRLGGIRLRTGAGNFAVLAASRRALSCYSSLATPHR